MSNGGALGHVRHGQSHAVLPGKFLPPTIEPLEVRQNEVRGRNDIYDRMPNLSAALHQQIV
jgi:hypothetical protein